jgi:hypothetical protein
MLSRQDWPHDPQQLDGFYGNPRGFSGANPQWEAENLTTFSFPWQIRSGGQVGRIHQKVKPSLVRVLQAIWDRVGHDQTEIAQAGLDEFGGSYNYRQNRNNPAALSNHARGIALDLAPSRNPNGAAWLEGGAMLPRFVIEAFKAEGWRWGGDFGGTKDPMHFEAVFDQHHDQPPVPAPVSPPQGEGGARGAPGGGLPPAPMPVPVPAIPAIGDDLIGEAIRRWVIAKTGLPAEVDRFKADLLAQVLILAAKIQAFTLEPTAPQVRVPAPSGHLLPDLMGLPPHVSADPSRTMSAPAQMQNVQAGIIATVFGGASDYNESAYDGHVIADDEEGCALPYRFPSPRPSVCIAGPNGHTVTVPIVDVGPIYPSKRGPADLYWQTGARPRAETNRVLSQAGIDLTPRTARDLAIDGKGKVDWWFATDFATGDQPPTGETNMPSQETPNIPSFLVNWKTSAAGLVPMLLALADLITQITSGHLDPNHVYADLGALAVGLGLVGASDAKK